MTRILAISGSLRSTSTNTAALRTAVVLAPEGVTVELLVGLDELPHFNPDDDVDPLPPTVQTLRRAMHESDAVMFSTPEYAGTLPGSFKNLLDWTVGGTELNDKPIGWINTSPFVGRGSGATDTLVTVLHYVAADIVEAACVSIPIHRELVGPDGIVTDESICAQISGAISALAAGNAAPS